MISHIVGLLLLAVIPATEASLQTRCSGDQITWIYESGQMISCSPCPACPPGSEYSIPCSTKAINGTPAECVACPTGKFSNKFNKKPCVACTRCSRQYTKMVCTVKRNSVCGGCVAGYYYNEVSFSCEECGRCCKDGKDQIPLGCARVGMCKTRPYGCPNIQSPRKINTKKSWTSTKSNNGSKLSTPIMENLKSPSTPTLKSFNPSKSYLTKKEDQGTVNDIPKGKDEDTSLQTLLYVAIALIVLVSLVAAGIKFSSHFERTNRPDFIRSTSYSTTTALIPEPSPEDRTLEYFVANDHDAVDIVCIRLGDKRREGLWDFERVALRFGLSQEENIAIRNAAHTEGGNPTRELLECLCNKRPKITVKQFAEIAKKIKRTDVCDVLQHFFSKQATLVRE